MFENNVRTSAHTPACAVIRCRRPHRMARAGGVRCIKRLRDRNAAVCCARGHSVRGSQKTCHSPSPTRTRTQHHHAVAVVGARDLRQAVRHYYTGRKALFLQRAEVQRVQNTHTHTHTLSARLDETAFRYARFFLRRIIGVSDGVDGGGGGNV